jgi:flavin-dependent dehydrogenase
MTMPALRQFDLTIIGASFAGLACARTAALRGLNVAVVDAQPQPGARIRTTGLLVKEAVDALDLPAHLMRKIRGVRLYAPNLNYLDLHAPGYFFQATSTGALLQWMAEEARRAGATFYFGTRFDSALQDDDGLSLPTLGIRTRYLVGADGARSRVGQFFRLGLNRRFLVGAEIECEPISAMDERFLHCFADSGIAPGYIGWAVPGVGVTQIGAAALRNRKPDLEALGSVLERLWRIEAPRIFERRSGLIPVGGPVHPLGRGRVLLIGDAAGLVSPLTGGGIHTALSFGRRAAQLVADWLLDCGPHPLAQFSREIPRFGLKRALRRVADFAPPNALVNLLLMTPPMRAFAQRVYFHRRASALSFEDWEFQFEQSRFAPQPPAPDSERLRCI